MASNASFLELASGTTREKERKTRARSSQGEVGKKEGETCSRLVTRWLSTGFQNKRATSRRAYFLPSTKFVDACVYILRQMEGETGSARPGRLLQQPQGEKPFHISITNDDDRCINRHMY